MSKMLEQAIIDATALKEAALKSAETEIVEKYAPEVKKVMEQILEAEEDELEQTMGMDMDTDGVEDPVAMSLPTAATDGENACACPDEGEPQEVVLDLPGFAAVMAQETEPSMDDLEPTETALEPVTETEEDMLEEDELEAIVSELLGEEEETLEEETVEEIHLEEEKVEEETQPVVAEAKEENNESLQLEAIAGKTNELFKTITALQEQNDKFSSDNNKLVSETTEQKENIQKLTTTLEELSLQNAKLLYINEVLKSNSLNERQRKIAVEALEEVESVEQAKTVFDTLQSTVASSTKRLGRTESLSEAVSNNTSIRMPRPKQQQSTDSHSTRWKLLAGIK
jgi:hypothetical protein